MSSYESCYVFSFLDQQRQCWCTDFALVNDGCAADSGKDGQSVTISYQLSSQKCLVDGWTVCPLACPLVRCESVDVHSLCDEMLESYEPLYKVSSCL